MSQATSKFRSSTVSRRARRPNDKRLVSLGALDSWAPGVSGGENAPVQVIDMFSGCGGMSLGFAAHGKQSGIFKLVGAVDINETSLNTYARNFGVPAVKKDVRELARSPLALRNLLGSFPDYDPTKPLVLIGCAPCQGFSAHRKKHWDRADVRNSLVEEFASIAAAMAPDCVLMENVPELLSGRYWEHFEAFRTRLVSNGYTVKQEIHNAAEYGTPQERFRALVMAMRTPRFALPPPLLSPTEFFTVNDAIADLPEIEPGQVCATDAFHRCARHRPATIEVIKAVPMDGGSRPSGIGPACLDRVKGFSDVYGRLSWNKPAITITHYARNPASGRFLHPEQHRGLTMREAARLQGFPDSFVFTGKFDDVFRQIGEAVPPRMSLMVARAVADSLGGSVGFDDDPRQVSAPLNDSYASVIAGIKKRRA